MPLENWDRDQAKIERQAMVAMKLKLADACKVLVNHAKLQMRQISPIVQLDINREAVERDTAGPLYDVLRRGESQRTRTMTRKQRQIIKAIDSSPPGGYPYYRTGNLQRSLTYEIKGLEARWGTNVKYGRYLQTGTRSHKVTVKHKRVLMNKLTGQVFGKTVEVSMKPRPWMSLTNAECMPQLREILTGGFSLTIAGKGIE